jgi:hypothetical protein
MSDSRAIYLRPSAAHAWGRCAGYALLNARVATLPMDEADNEVREDGTACHWWSQEQWEGRPAALGSLSPNGRVLTEELQHVVDEYLGWLAKHPERPVLEQTLPVSAVFPGVQDGTPDAYSISGTTLDLDDLKAGFRPVEVWRNPQLIVYAWTLMALHPHVQDANLTIVQPRGTHPHGTIRTWYVTRDELRPLAEALQAAARNAWADDPQCTVNPSCRNCAAAGSCRTLAAAGGTGIELSYDATPHVLTPAELGYELTKLLAAAEHMEHRITGLTTQAEHLSKRGQRVPGFDMARAGTKWRWRAECLPQVEQLARLMGVDIHAPKTVRTVAQLRHSFHGVDVQSLYAERPTGDLRLKPTDPNEAYKAFSQRKK